MVKNIGFLFPGQGSQYVGMGKSLAEHSTARELFQRADDFLGYSLSTLMWDGPEDKLRDTRYTQPALFVASAAALSLLKEYDLKPIMAGGHSLGEYSALYSANVLTFENALKLVHERGKAMTEASQINPGTMAAIIGLSSDILSEICKKASTVTDICAPANFNSENQIVIAGTKIAVNAAMQMAKEAGALKTVELNVSGAFHTPLMQEAANKMHPLIELTPFADAAMPIVTNVDAQATTSSVEFKNKLTRQITNPVLWNDSVKKMISAGVEFFIEVGAGKVLSALMKRLDRSKIVTSTEDPESIKKHLILT